MSVPELRRKRKLAVVVLAAAALVVSAAASLAASSPVPVKATPRNEISPAAGNDWFAWSKSRGTRESPFDVYAQQTGYAAFKVNPKGTQAYTGGIDGTTLLYQLIRGRTGARSDLRLYDLATRRQPPMPAGVNSSQWECCGTISAGWILYSRGESYSRDTQLILLRNLTTGEQRVLDALRNRKGLTSAGQLNGNFAVWRRCNPHPRCQTFRYDLATASATALPTAPGKVVYAPSVNEYGTAYYVQSDPGCGKAVQLVKQPLDGGAEVIASIPPGRDIDVTYAHHVIESPPEGVRRTRVYYDLLRCKTHKWDIYSVDDTEALPPPP